MCHSVEMHMPNAAPRVMAAEVRGSIGLTPALARLAARVRAWMARNEDARAATAAVTAAAE